MNISELNIKIIDNINGYDICFTLFRNKNGLNMGRQNSLMFVKKDENILFIANSNLDQFHMKLQCEEYINSKTKEKELTND